ncbi:MAG TPA: zinc ribbon domain-containing protein [Vicinamibacterales bacterium]|nr:zinc ribbon domain-containing protein [Vicinamibacterales bacterium]
MPLYEYQCDACGHRFERIQKFSDPPIDKCPECGGTVRKLISSPAIQFKGSGWYVTDYARKPEKSDSAGKSDSGAGASDASAGSTDGASSSEGKDASKEASKDSPKDSAKDAPKETAKPAPGKTTPGSKT